MNKIGIFISHMVSYDRKFGIPSIRLGQRFIPFRLTTFQSEGCFHTILKCQLDKHRKVDNTNCI